MLTRSLVLLFLVSNSFAAPLTSSGSGTEAKTALEAVQATNGVIESHHEEAGSHHPQTSEDMFQASDSKDVDGSDGVDENDLFSLLKEINEFCIAIEQSNMHEGYGKHAEWMDIYNTLCFIDVPEEDEDEDEEAGSSHRQKRSAPAKRVVRESDMVASERSDRRKRELFLLPDSLLERMKQHTGSRAHFPSHHSSDSRDYGELLASQPEDDEDEDDLSEGQLELTDDDMGTLQRVIQEEADKLDLDVEMITHEGRIGFFFPLGDAPEAMDDEDDDEDDSNDVEEEFDNRISPMAYKRSSRTPEIHHRWSTDDKKRVALKRQEQKRRSLLRLAEYLAREHQPNNDRSDA